MAWRKHDLSNRREMIGFQTERKGIGSRFSVASFNVMAQQRAKPSVFQYCLPKALKWRCRRAMLWEEVIHRLGSDIICLQEVDSFETFWRPGLCKEYYDAVFVKRGGLHKQGVAVCFRNEMLSPCGTLSIDFNVLAKDVPPDESSKYMTNDVAVLVMLQPWGKARMQSGLLVCCCVLNEHSAFLRELQLTYLLQEIEKFNCDFCVPVILCGSMFFSPVDPLYSVVRTGFHPKKKAVPAVPKKPSTSEITLSTITLTWDPPRACGAPITAYVIERLVGGSTVLGFRDRVTVTAEPLLAELAAVKDDAERAAKRHQLLQELVHTDPPPLAILHETQQQVLVGDFPDGDFPPPCRKVITGLSSGVAYSFRLAAVNRYGQGGWSEPSDPVETHALRENAPVKRSLCAVEDVRLPRLVGSVAAGEPVDTGFLPRFEDGTVNLLVSPVRGRFGTGGRRDFGGSDRRRLHNTVLRSAFSKVDEPSFTTLTPEREGTYDYIWFTYEALEPRRLVVFPKRATIGGERPNVPRLIEDPKAVKPRDWEDKPTLLVPSYDTGKFEETPNPKYKGPWKRPMMLNPHFRHPWLPNERWGEGHRALTAAATPRTTGR